MSIKMIEQAFSTITVDILSIFNDLSWDLKEIEKRFSEASLDTIKKVVFKTYYKGGIIVLDQHILDNVDTREIHNTEALFTILANQFIQELQQLTAIIKPIKPVKCCDLEHQKWMSCDQAYFMLGIMNRYKGIAWFEIQDQSIYMDTWNQWKYQYLLSYFKQFSKQRRVYIVTLEELRYIGKETNENIKKLFTRFKGSHLIKTIQALRVIGTAEFNEFTLEYRMFAERLHKMKVLTAEMLKDDKKAKIEIQKHMSCTWLFAEDIITDIYTPDLLKKLMPDDKDVQFMLNEETDKGKKLEMLENLYIYNNFDQVLQCNTLGVTDDNKCLKFEFTRTMVQNRGSITTTQVDNVVKECLLVLRQIFMHSLKSDKFKTLQYKHYDDNLRSRYNGIVV